MRTAGPHTPFNGQTPKQDGVLRNHDVRREGNVGDVVVFSIIDREWPTVRLGLSEKVRSFTD